MNVAEVSWRLKAEEGSSQSISVWLAETPGFHLSFEAGGASEVDAFMRLRYRFY
jgi:hypothetical protein